MPVATAVIEPGLSSYLKSLKGHSAETSVENLIALLKRRQIRNSRPCAIATTHLFLRLVAEAKFDSVPELLRKIRDAGRRLASARHTELAVGNIVRRVLGLIREVSEPASDKPAMSNGGTPGLLSRAPSTSALSQPIHQPEPESQTPLSMRDVKEDVLNGLREMLDELDQADEQIAGYALEQIQPSEAILAPSASLTAHKFLLAAARRGRRFTLFLLQGYPNNATSTLSAALHGPSPTLSSENSTASADTEQRLRPLRAAGVTVVLVPDAAIYALMPRVTKVLLPAAAALPNGGVLCPAGSRVVAAAARAHRVPVLALCAVYKISPLSPADPDALAEAASGDASAAARFADADVVRGAQVINPTLDYVPERFVDLFITNIGAVAPGYVYRIAADHYRDEDKDL